MRIAIIVTWALAIIAVILFLGPENILTSYTDVTPQGIRDFVFSAGGIADLVFLVISILRPVFFLPVTPFTISSGFLFGFWQGLLLSTIGTTISSAMTFIISRYLFHDYVRTRLVGRYQLLDKAMECQGWRYVMFFRMIPILPYDLVGYVAGASTIRFRDYMIGSMLGELPGAVVLVFFGSTLDKIGSNMFYGSLLLAVVVLLAPEVIRRVANRRNEQLAR